MAVSANSKVLTRALILTGEKDLERTLWVQNVPRTRGTSKSNDLRNASIDLFATSTLVRHDFIRVYPAPVPNQVSYLPTHNRVVVLRDVLTVDLQYPVKARLAHLHASLRIPRELVFRETLLEQRGDQ